jgi:predicted MFS family arabinose efflux permease
MGAPYERWIMAEGFLGEVFVTLTGGVFLTGLALQLGAGPVQLALLAALPFLAQAGQLWAPRLERRLASRRAFVVPAVAFARALWLVPGLLAALGARDGAALAAAMAAMFAMGFLVMVGANGWTAWMADLVPPSERARIFGRRAWAVACGTLVTAPAGALLLDHLPKRVAFGTLGLVAATAGIAASRALRRVPDAVPHPYDGETLPATACRLWKQPRFRAVLGLFTLWNVAIGVPSPFWTLYMLEELHMSFFQVTVYTCWVLVVRLLCNGHWSRVIDHIGSRRVLIGCGFAIAIVPLIWILPAPGRLWPFFCEATLSGIAWTGFNQAAFIQPMSALDPPDRSRGLALLNVATGAALFGAALFGGGLLGHLGARDHGSFMVLFLISSALRAGTALLALRLTEPGMTLRGFFVGFVGHGVLRRPSAGRMWIPVEVHDEHPQMSIESNAGVAFGGSPEQNPRARKS